MKDLKDYLHLYLGCEVLFDNKLWLFYQIGIKTIRIKRSDTRNEINISEAKPILRPLSDMTEDEIIEVIQRTAPDEMEDKPTADDYSIEMFYNDDGNMVDADVAVGCNYSCRCAEGQVAIRKCGSVHFFDEECEPVNIYNMPPVYAYLLSKHFDLFGLIESGLAIDATTLKTQNTNQL